MLTIRRSPRTGYVIAVCVVALILLTRGYLGPTVGGLLTSIEFILGVLAASALGGWRPGVFATVLGLLGVVFFFVEPRYTFFVSRPSELLWLLPYVVLGPSISFLCEGLHSAWMRIAERQRSLEEEIDERKRAERALHEADRRKDEFLATLAHELRNPLAPIATGLQVLKQPGIDDETSRKVKSIMERQINSMVRLIDDLLDVSRITRGKIELQRQHMQLATVVSRAVDAVQPFISDKLQKLTVAVPSEKVFLYVDPVRMTQVLANLLNNASKFSEIGKEIRIVAECRNGEAVIRVQDSGAGLSRQELQRVFEMFWQNRRGVTGEGSGLGIGLTLALRLVELHGGRLSASSEGPGRGSCFEVSLPIVPGEFIEDTDSSSKLFRNWKPSGRRVLVVDDNADAAESLAKLLRLRSYDVQIADNGPHAISTAATFHPDVVLLDISMPGMDGYEVARRLRELPQASSTLLVALSGYGRESDVRKSLDAGFHHHLTKPASLETLYDVLESRQAE